MDFNNAFYKVSYDIANNVGGSGILLKTFLQVDIHLKNSFSSLSQDSLLGPVQLNIFFIYLGEDTEDILINL